MLSFVRARRGGRWAAGAPAGVVGPLDRLRCDARVEVVPDSSLRSLRSLRSDRIRQVRLRSAWVHAPTSTLCSSSPQKSPPPTTTHRDAEGFVLAAKTSAASAKANRGSAGRACGTEPGHKQSGGLFVPGEGPVLLARRSLQGPKSGGFLAARASAHRPHACRILFERRERSERSELCDRPGTRAPRGSRRPSQSHTQCRPGSPLPR